MGSLRVLGWAIALMAVARANLIKVGDKTTLAAQAAQAARERGSVALLTVPLRGGGLRKCTGVAVSPKDVLAAAGCVADIDETKLVQVQVLSPSASPLTPWEPQSKLYKDSRHKKVIGGAFPKKKFKGPKHVDEMRTRFSRYIVKLALDQPGGSSVVLLRLTAPLEGVQGLPVALEGQPISGSAACTLYAWGITNGVPVEARLARADARGGNWTACWQRAGVGPNARGTGRLCALADGCLPADAGAALLCGPKGALAGLAAPSLGATTPGSAYGRDPCAGAAVQLHALSALLPGLSRAAPHLTLAPSGLHHVSPHSSHGLPVATSNGGLQQPENHRHRTSRRRPRTARVKRSHRNHY